MKAAFGVTECLEGAPQSRPSVLLDTHWKCSVCEHALCDSAKEVHRATLKKNKKSPVTKTNLLLIWGKPAS